MRLIRRSAQFSVVLWNLDGTWTPRPTQTKRQALCAHRILG